MNNQSNIISWLKKRHTTISVFIALMVNLMVFSQPLEQILNQRIANLSSKNYYPSYSSYNNYTPTLFPKDKVTDNNQYQNSVAAATQPQTSSITSTNLPLKNLVELSKVDGDVISALEKQGIIGKSENFPIDDPMDNVFSFEILSDVKTDKDIYLTYELFGLTDASQATKSVNSQLATGGLLVKTNKEWTTVEEKLDPSQLQKGKNHVFFTTSEDAKHQYMVRGLRLVYKEKEESKTINFHQKEAISYDGMLQISGYVSEPNINEVKIENQTVKVINGQFEAIVHNPILKTTLEVSYTNAANQSISESITVKQLIEKPTAIYKEIRSLASVSKKFLKSTTNTLNFAGATLQVDSLQLDVEQSFSITGLSFKDMPTLSQEMVNVTADYKAYRMLPSGSHFEKYPAKISIKYDESKLPSGYTAKDIKTFYFDNDQKKWMELAKDTIHYETKEIVSKTTHFTDFINGIIKVPESPETGSYTPTSIKDIKAADPTAGVVSIAPPTPNNMGTVNTSFPIKLPAGRAGMQPSLSVSYNSEGGNGWMGLGWDLSIPGVSLDTRWGAPRYGDTDGNGTFDNKETEIYSMGGGVLTLDSANPNGGTTTPNYTNPHRTDDISSNTTANQRQFYPRIEGSYAKIIRHGNNPTNYWWEVTDKTGNKSFYGGYRSNTVQQHVEENTVIKTNQDNISYWGLYRTEDTNGNYVEYVYQNNYGIDVNSGQPGTGGNEFYIKEIRYTLHTSDGNNLPQNYYKVTFNRNTYSSNAGGGSTTPRKDVQINAKNGVVQVTKDLLAEISVDMVRNSSSIPPLTEHIRSYRFGYNEPDNDNEGLFFKTLLTSISEYDASGDLFYKNTMEYQKKGDDNTDITENNFFKNTSTNNWQLPNADGIDGSLILGGLSGDISGEFSKKGSILGTSQSNGGNGGLYTGFGICCGGTKNLTAGVSGSYSRSISTGLISFTDINGDGLPDKVYNKNGFKFRPNTGSSFGNEISLPTTFSNISSSFSSSISVGVQANFFAFAGYTFNTSENTTTSYLSDINGDGLVDVVNEGQVFFNSTTNDGYLNNSLTFSANSGTTSNPVSQGTISQTIINNIRVKHIDELRDENPQHDIVKVWIAPKDGFVNITGNVTLDPVLQLNANTFPTQITDYDGIRASIQRNQVSPLWFDGTRNPTFTASQTPNTTPLNINLLNRQIFRGDRLYFRLQSREEGNFDRVSWTPNIQYVDENTTASNVDNISYFSSNADQGFILSHDAFLIIPQSGDITFSWPNSTVLNNTINPYQFSDDLTFTIEQGTLNGNQDFVVSNTYTSTINQNNTHPGLQFAPILPTTVTGETLFRFRVTSDSNVDWKAINWRPVITLTPTGATNTTQFFGVVDYSIYNRKINPVISRVVLPNANTILVRPRFNTSTFETSTDIANNSTHTFNLVVKNSSKRVLAKQLITVTKNSLGVVAINGSNDISITQNITSPIYIEYYTNSLAAANVGSTAISAQVFQASTNLPAPAYVNPTGTCTANRLTSVNIAGITDNSLTCPNYYENRISAVTTPNVFKGTTIAINTSNFSTGFAAVWIDFNRNNAINTGEFFTHTTTSLNQPFNIPVPADALDGHTRIRIRGGNTVAFPINTTATTFLAANISGTFRDYQINVLPTTPIATTNDVYCNVGIDRFGPMYRNWGQFAYHGGIVIRRGLDLMPLPATQAERQAPVLLPNGNPEVIAQYSIDTAGNIIPIVESELENTNNSNINQNTCNQHPYGSEAYLNCLQQNNTTSITRTRFFSLQPKPETQVYENGEKVYVSATHFSTERFGEDNLNKLIVNLPTGSTGATTCSTDNFRVVPLINKGEGHSFSGGGSYGPFGANGNYSSSFNWAELNYQDMNGDRYPDVITRDNVQFTNNLGQLSNMSNLGFGRVTTSDSDSWGAGVSGSFKVAKTPGTYKTFSMPDFIGGFFPVSIPVSEPQVSSGSVSAGVGGGSNSENLMWVDINGDGLADRLSLGSAVRVRLNLGYAISTQEQIWSAVDGDIGSKSSSINGGLGFSIANGSYSGGVSASSSKSYTKKNIFDINADGLPDLVFNTDNGGLSYRINTGNGFSNTIQSTHNAYTNYSRSTGEGLNGSFTIPINIPFFGIKFAITPSVGWDKSVSREENSLNDINGDGYPDILSVPETGNNTADNLLNVRLSNIGHVNLLKKVNSPTGGFWEVTYQKTTNSYNLPQVKYTMSAVKTYDGFVADGSYSPNYTLSTFEYTNPNQNRREREFFGFETVRTNLHDVLNNNQIYKYTIQEYHNDNYYLKGASKKETLYDANDVIWTQKLTTYGIYETISTGNITINPTIYGFTDTTTPIDAINALSSNLQNIDSNFTYPLPGTSHNCTILDRSRLFVTPILTIERFTEGLGITNAKNNVTLLESFDAYGNVLRYRNYGEQNADVYTSSITYYNSISGLDYSPGFARFIRVRDSNGVLLKEREAIYNGQGDLFQVKTTLVENTNFNTIELKYDIYGNIIKQTNLDSVNSTGTSFYRDYTYDNVVHTFPVKVKDAFGYESETIYNYLFGAAIFSKDMNHQPMRTRIDDRGRTVEITGPHELFLEGLDYFDGAWTIRFDYQQEASIANTLQNFQFDQFGNTIPYVNDQALIVQNYNSTINANQSFKPDTSITQLNAGNPIYSLTRHFDPEYRTGPNETSTTNQILTVTLVDGFGKPVQVKKSAAIFDGTPTIDTSLNPNPLNDNTLVWLINGKSKTDAFGRVLESYYTTTC